MRRLAIATLALVLLGLAGVAPVGAVETTDPVINEFVANHTGTDTNEFVEVFADASTDYSAFTLLEVEGDGTGAGVVDEVVPIGTTDGAGFWTTGFLNNAIENGTVTLLLVEGFSGSLGADLDTNDDGVLDVSPWSRVVDDVAVSDGGTSDRTYSSVVLAPGFGGSPFTPAAGHASPTARTPMQPPTGCSTTSTASGSPASPARPHPARRRTPPGQRTSSSRCRPTRSAGAGTRRR